MVLLSQVPIGGATLTLSLSTKRGTLNSAPKFTNPIPPLFSSRRPPKLSSTSTNPRPLLVVNSDASGSGAGGGPPPATKSTPFKTNDDSISFVGEDKVPLEGVIQFEKPNSSALINKWGRVALLAGGDVMAILLFAAVGRLSHGFSVFNTETLRTADPFIAGWFLSAYFLGGYGEEGRGMNGHAKAVIAAAKSWSLGIPLGIIIRAATIGHIPPTNFILVTMGSTSVLLIGWRALLFSFLTNDKSKKNDVYKSGSPFELFELLTSLVRRW
ncbi:hypothetical protein LguiB_017402 [Lonicera macranthoides]